MPTKIFMTGVTGFIGPAVLERLLNDKDSSHFDITSIVRSQVKAEKLRDLGIHVVHGSLDDLALTEKQAADADIVISMADADNLDIAKAILRGMKRYHQSSGSVPILLHTSGTGVLTDDAAGDRSTDVIYDDMNPEKIEALPDTQPHRPVDLGIVKADREGYIKSYIILPSMVYGLGSGRMVDLGVRNRFSIVFPTLIKAAIDRGRSGIFGSGKNIWNNVHVDDIVDLYLILFDAIRENRKGLGHGQEGYYFAENGEHTMYELGKAIGEGLVALGMATESEPTAFTNDEIELYFQGSTFWDKNTRARASRARLLGWKPVKTSNDLLEGMLDETRAVLGVSV